MGRNKNIKDYLSGGKRILFLFVLSVVFQPSDIEYAFYIKILYTCMYSYTQDKVMLELSGTKKKKS